MDRCVHIFWICWLLACLGACRPADKAPPPVAVLEDTAALAHQVDSTHQIGQDGLDYVPLNTGTYQQLPPELTAILDLEYPGWMLPEIPAEDLRQVDRQAQGPYYVSADFDRNGQQDFAVQFQIRDTTLVAAYLWQGRQPPRKFILARQPLARRPGEKQNLLVVSQDTHVAATGPAVRLTREGIAIGREPDTRIFLFKEDTFSVATPKHQDER